MKVNTTQDAVQSLLQTSVANEKSQVNFLAALETAKQNLIQPKDMLSQTKVISSTEKLSPTGTKTAIQELEEYLKKNPIQRMREAILKDMGLTEEGLKAMPPVQRAAIEDAIAAKIKEFLLGHHDTTQISSQIRTPQPGPV